MHPEPPDPPIPAAGSVALDQIVSLTPTRRIHLIDDWTGLSPVAPINKHYTLSSAAEGWHAEVSFEIARRMKRLEIGLPAEVIAEFLRLVGQVPLTTESLGTGWFLTDHYPRVQLTIESEVGSVRLSSISQTPDRTPWEIRIEDAEAGSERLPGNSPEPDRPSWESRLENAEHIGEPKDWTDRAEILKRLCGVGRKDWSGRTKLEEWLKPPLAEEAGRRYWSDSAELAELVKWLESHLAEDVCSAAVREASERS